MITLITGVPGSGKTLWTIWHVKDLAKRENRPVFYSGISNLNTDVLDWQEFEAEKWFELPEGSIIVIDECQSIYRPRANGAQVPKFVSELETHRHHGYDIFLTTQHPMLVDQNLRRLVGRHLHVMRKFGMHNATLHEWGQCKNSCDSSRKDSIKTKWAYPREVFDYYKSAELHTHKVRIPFRMLFLWTSPIWLGLMIWVAYHYLMRSSGSPDDFKPKPVMGAQAQNQPGPSSPNSATVTKKTFEDWVEEQKPRVAGLPFTAPAYDEATRPKSVPAPQACVSMGTKCQCYTDQGTKIRDMPIDMCRTIVEDGIYLSYQQPPQQQQLGQQQQQQSVAQGQPSFSSIEYSAVNKRISEPEHHMVASRVADSSSISIGLKNPAMR